MRNRQSSIITCAIAMVIALAANAQPQGEAVAPPLSTLQQTVRHFDFEHDNVAGEMLPFPFYRHIAPAAGFPPFGSMRLSRRAAHSGAYSLEFELAGGSMSARIPTSTIPVLPLADYVVTVQARTEGLRHARVRLAAWLHDAAGRPIAASLSHSRLLNSDGQWQALSVEIRGGFVDAADLVLELQIVQPSQYLADDSQSPRYQDTRGKAWFDDVTVAHLPRMALSMPGGALVRQARDAAATAHLRLSMSDVGGSPMSTRLRVMDVQGATVYDSSFPAPRGRQNLDIHIPTPRCGWYRAALDINNETGMTQRRWIDFVVLPQAERAGPANDGRFGIILNQDVIAAHADALKFIDEVHCGRVVLPAWSTDSSVVPSAAGNHPQTLARRELVSQLLRRQIEVILALQIVPDELARSLSLQTNQVFDLLMKDSQIWRPLLDDLLVNFGLQAQRWLIDAREADGQIADSMQQHELPAAFDLIARSLSDFVPDPIFHTIATVEQLPEPGVPSPPAGVGIGHFVAIPHHVQPQAIEQLLEPWLRENADMLAILELLPEHEFAPHQRVIDAALRMLHAWRSGVATLAIHQPWSVKSLASFDSSITMPSPIYGAWSTVASQLSGRSFVMELNFGEGIHGWLLKGRSFSETGANDALLIAWCDRADAQHPVTLQSQLGTGQVRVTDLFGNASTVDHAGAGAPPPVHSIALTDMPAFIEGVNLELVQFRASMTIEPAFVPAVSRVHERHIVLRNPWDLAIAGTLRVSSEDSGWQLSPSVQEFAIRPGAVVRLPINITPQRNMLAGRKIVNVHITLNADRTYSMRLQAALEVGLEDIDLSTSWMFVANAQTGVEDLVITQSVTNRGNRSVNLDLFMLAPGISQARRTIAGLGAGETAIRTFRVPNGAALLTGKQVRVGIAERDGLTRLSSIIDLARRH